MEKVNYAFAQPDGIYCYSDVDGSFLCLRLLVNDLFTLQGYVHKNQVGSTIVSLQQLRTMFEASDKTDSALAFPSLEVLQVITKIGEDPISNQVLELRFFQKDAPQPAIHVIRPVFAEAVQLASNRPPVVPFVMKMLQGGMINIALTTTPEKGLSVMKSEVDVRKWLTLPIGDVSQPEGALHGVVKKDTSTLMLTFASRGGGLYSREVNITEFERALNALKKQVH